jgi:hypothetical protein
VPAVVPHVFDTKKSWVPAFELCLLLLAAFPLMLPLLLLLVALLMLALLLLLQVSLAAVCCLKAAESTAADSGEVARIMAPLVPWSSLWTNLSECDGAEQLLWEGVMENDERWLLCIFGEG